MASQTGTSTDYRDFIDDLVTFITANGWTVERNTTTTVGTDGLGVDGIDNKEIIVRGDGGGSKNIYWGMTSFQDSSAGYYNLQLRGFTGYNSSNSFATQPGISPACYLPMQNTSMTYWMFATGRRVCAVVKTGTSYQFMYCGFFNAYATDEASEYPYPLVVMGSTNQRTSLFNSNSQHFSSFADPGSSSSSTTFNQSHSPGYLRFIDGAWYGIKNFHGNSSALTNNVVNIWPTCKYTTRNIPSADLSEGSDIYDRVFYTIPGGTPEENLLRTENGADAAVVPMFPATLILRQPSFQLLGELDGLYWCSGGGGVTAEDVVTDGVTTNNFIIFQNIHRSDNWKFSAIKDI